MSNYTQNNNNFYRQQRFVRGQKQQVPAYRLGPQQQKLLAYLHSHNLTPTDLADQTGLQAPLLLDWLQSDTLLPLHLLAAIGPLLGIEAPGEKEERVTIAAHVPLATSTTAAAAATAIKTKTTPGKLQTVSSATPSTVTASKQKKMKPGRVVSRTRIHYLVLPPSPTAFAQSTPAAGAASTLTATATASPVKGPTPGKPVAPGQLDMIRALLNKKKSESESHLVARLCGSRPLEELTHAEARRVLWDLTQATHGGLQAIRDAEQKQKITQKAQQQRRAAQMRKVASSANNINNNSKKA